MADRFATDHHAHAAELVARYAAGDLAGTERDRAAALVASCEECAVLAADLRAIGAATRADAAFVATAPRDFRITPAVAARNRRPSIAERLAAAFGRPSGARRPVGAAVATLGLAGILLFGLPVGSFLGVATGTREYALSPAGQPVPADGKAYGPQASSAGQGAGVPAFASPVPAGSGTGAVDAGGAAPGPPTERGTGGSAPFRVALGTISIVLVLGGTALALIPSGRRRRRP